MSQGFNNKHQIGIAIVTFNRSHRIDHVLQSVQDHAPAGAEVVVVNDGIPYPDKNWRGVTRVNLGVQMGVAAAKNMAISQLRTLGCDQLFILEDDIEVLSGSVWDAYITAANKTGVHHLNFQHSNGNGKTLNYTHMQDGEPALCMYGSPEAGFSYFNAALFKAVAPFDTNFINAFEHIDMEYRLDLAGLAPPFWTFPDIPGSNAMLREVVQDGNDNSTITNKPGYAANWQRSAKHFIAKHGKFTTQIPYPSLDHLQARMQHLKDNYPVNDNT